MGNCVQFHMIQSDFILICLALTVIPSNLCATSTCIGSSSDERCSEFEMSSSKSSSAIMLYEPIPFLEPLQRDSRSFTLSGQHIHIHQKWNELGVAAVVWDAAIVLSEYLEKEVTAGRFELTGKKIIELGAGTGLVSIAVALLGGNIISTDRQEALGILQENVEGNFKGGHTPLRKSVTIQKLSWGEDLKAFTEAFNIILGADIIYVEETFGQLLDTIRHLSCSSSRVLLSCHIRYDRDLRFLGMLKEFYDVTRIHRDEARGIDIYEAVMKR